ncbi:hypothetical protein CVT26_011232 [Gymnopilus dilepis]|uniref:Phosphatidylglycerol lysyltransferase C-terminal domain-containing protein n=1 Tax=Gymnopilus dilepis TaxID=231916 RepID=A0A409WRJ7_9AGAR|nr:hypothetical protein CVT26_011232 [Gymnopilus dilepis]
MAVPDKDTVADLVAKYGSSSSTAWLEFERYKLWQPSEPVPESSFTPVQGYMEKDPYVFAWGNPLVSDPAALPNVARQFIRDFESQGKRVVWCCVDRDLEEILGGPEFDWSTVSCIYEDVVDPAHLIEITSPEMKGKEGQHAVKDLKKNLYRANKYDVKVHEVKNSEWTEEDKAAVEQGIKDWKENKSGVQIASTTLQPWLDSTHRRYWIVGFLILTPIQSTSWQIKNAVSFPSAPKGTSEALIYTALKDLHEEEEKALSSGQKIPHPVHGVTSGDPIQPTHNGTANGTASSDTVSEASASGVSIDSTSSTSEVSERPTPTPSHRTSSSSLNSNSSAGSGKTTKRRGEAPPPSKTHHRDENRVTVTFGISAAPDFQPIRNLGGWKVKALSKTYSKVASGAKLINRGDFRNKFDSEHDPMYVCYPPDGFGLDGVNALLKLLRK